jgi:hypothetical protein
MSITASVLTRKVPIRNINWNDDKDLFLLRGIQQIGCHIKPRKWNTLMDNFCYSYKEYEYMIADEGEKRNCIRRLKNRFNHLRDECTRIMESGNRSALKTPELSDKYDLMKGILKQSERAKEEKMKEKERTKKMGSFESEILAEDESSDSSESIQEISAIGGIRVPAMRDKKRSLITEPMVRFIVTIHVSNYALTLSCPMYRNPHIRRLKVKTRMIK